MSSRISTAPAKKSYDYIIVGGGTSGLVVANRLSADPKISVLVIEAGTDRTDDPRVLTPGLMNDMYGDPSFEWMITGVPQKQLGGRTLAHLMGRTLGGSSAINMCCVVYPSKANFDAWAELGNPGWEWDKISPYLQNLCPTLPKTHRQRTEGDGPIQVSFAETYLPYHTAWVPTFEKLHHPPSGDPVSGISAGPFLAGVTINPKTKMRSHAGVGYYNPQVAQRGNLAVLTETLVERLLFSKEQDGSITAIGAMAKTKDGSKHELFAHKEVILAAGSFKSPQLLELSGIGNKSLLHAHRIDVLIDNRNVGENLQDHGLVPCAWEVADGQMSGDIMRDPLIVDKAMAAYRSSGDGPLSEFPFTSSYVTLQPPTDLVREIRHRESLDKCSFNLNRQHGLLYRILERPEEPIGQCSLVPRQLKAGDNPLPKYTFGLDQKGQYISLCGILNHPFSRGSTHIHSNDPALNPSVDIGFLRHPVDLELHAQILIFMQTLVSTEPLARLIKPDGRKLHLNEGKQSMHSLSDAKAVARQRVVSNNHPCGTCAMLPREQGGVVNSRLMVHGTNNLRIVDASIFPLIPRGNIQSTVYAVAERAADLIAEDSLRAPGQRGEPLRDLNGKRLHKLA